MSNTIAEQIFQKIDVNLNTFCWNWTKAKDKDGYALGDIEGKTRRMHRVSYEIFIGNIPKKLTIDHLCRNRNCINPSHLQAVTNKINLLRGEGIPAKNSRKTKCFMGHPLQGNNLLKSKDGYRRCRICAYRRYNANYHRSKQ